MELHLEDLELRLGEPCFQLGCPELTLSVPVVRTMYLTARMPQ
jgi:hypothetical protein